MKMFRRFVSLFFLPFFLYAYDWGLADEPFSPLPECSNGWAPASSKGYPDSYVDYTSYNLLTLEDYQYGWQYLTSGVYQRRLRKDVFVEDRRDANNNGDIVYRTIDYQQYVYCPPTPYCDPGYHYDFDIAQCVGDCPPNSFPDPDREGQCSCSPGYFPSYDVNLTLTCNRAECPIESGEFPPLRLIASVTSPSDCKFDPNFDSKIDEYPELYLVCCYGHPLDGDPVCPAGLVEINGNCYLPDSNETDPSDDKKCEDGFYWSINENKCLEIGSGAEYDGNGSSSDPLDGTSSDTNGDVNGDGNITNDELFGGDELGFWESMFNKYVNFSGVSSELNKLVDSYVLLNIPFRASGTCDSELTKTITVLGASYTIDARPWFNKFSVYFPFLKMLVLFLSAYAGIVIVLSSRGE